MKNGFAVDTQPQKQELSYIRTCFSNNLYNKQQMYVIYIITHNIIIYIMYVFLVHLLVVVKIVTRCTVYIT